jgi:hypothetical protein
MRKLILNQTQQALVVTYQGKAKVVVLRYDSDFLTNALQASLSCKAKTMLRWKRKSNLQD